MSSRPHDKTASDAFNQTSPAGDDPAQKSQPDPQARPPAQGFLIDPFASSITPWHYDGDYRTIRQAIRIGQSPFTIVQLENCDVIFVDDEGLLKPLDLFFAVKGYPQPIAGCGLLLGTDRDGDAVDARITLEALKGRILHLRLLSSDNPVTFLAAPTADPAPAARPLPTMPQARVMTLDQVMAWIDQPPPRPANPPPGTPAP